VTLASGFLCAGARHVLASHWGVADESTAELISAFFEATRAPDGMPVPYALALQRARKDVRARDKWASPMYWAPFVLIGTGEGTGQESPTAPPKADSRLADAVGGLGEPAADRTGAPADWPGRAWVLPLLGLSALVALGGLGLKLARSRRRARAT
jgi:hypothetical protein